MSANVLVVHGGGPTAVINASLYGVVEEAKSSGSIGRVYGAIGGSEGILKESFLDLMQYPEEKLSLLLQTPATAIGSSRYALKQEDYNAMAGIFRKYGIRYVLLNGGNGTMDTCGRIFEACRGEDIYVVGIPKTIDNDLWGTDMTFGFQSAVDVATNAIDCIHTTAASHGRVFIVEVMGHKVGWLTLYAGLAGGADIILLPEIPYDINIVCDALTKRSKAGKRFSILAVAEGAISREDAKMSKKELKEKKKSGVVYPSVAYEIGAKIQEVIGSEVRVTVPGHMQRGGEPCSYDRVLATRLGAAAARLIAQEQYGYMVAVKNNDITQVPLSEVAGRLKTVDPECSMIKEAKMVGISFGDE